MSRRENISVSTVEISRVVEDRAGPRFGITRVRRSNSGRRISNVKLPCSRGDTAIKLRRIVRTNMSILNRFSISFIVAVSK